MILSLACDYRVMVDGSKRNAWMCMNEVRAAKMRLAVSSSPTSSGTLRRGLALPVRARRTRQGYRRPDRAQDRA